MSVSACALGLTMRRLAQHEPDITDEIDGHFGDGGVWQWLTGFEPMLWQLNAMVARLPKGWRGNGDPQVWLNALHDHIPTEMLEWFSKYVIYGPGDANEGIPENRPNRNRVEAVLPNGVPAKLCAAIVVRRFVDQHGSDYTYSDTRVSEALNLYRNIRAMDREQERQQKR